MYLNLLNAEQKKLFLDYAYKLAITDGHYSEKEKNIMQLYCDEMQVSFDERTQSEDVPALVKKLKDICGEREKKIILFEVVGLTLIDNKYDVAEAEMINY